MFHNCPLTFQESTISNTHRISLHPSKPLIAYEASNSIELLNYNINGHKLIIPLNQEFSQLSFTPCGNFLMIIQQSAGVNSIRFITYEEPYRDICEPLIIESCDPVRLVAEKELHIILQYSKVIPNQIQQIYVVQSYKLKNLSQGGYSLHAYEIQNRNIDAVSYVQIMKQYVSNQEIPLMLHVSKDIQKDQLRIQNSKESFLRIIVCEKQCLKTLEYSVESQTVKISKSVRLPQEVKQIQLVEEYGLIIILYKSGDIQCINLTGQLLYEQKSNEQDGQFTCLTIQRTQLVCGTQKGALVFFNVLNGTFIKQIPFQSKLLKPFYVEYHLQKQKSIQKIMLNSSDQLLVLYQDHSYIFLDQTTKQVLKFHLGLNEAFKFMKPLPLANSDCFIAVLPIKNCLVMYTKNEHTQLQEYKIIDLNNIVLLQNQGPICGFDIENNLSFLAVIYQKLFVFLDMREFKVLKQFILTETDLNNSFDSNKLKNDYKNTVMGLQMIDDTTFIVETNINNVIFKIVQNQDKLLKIHEIPKFIQEVGEQKVKVVDNMYQSNFQQMQLLRPARPEVIELQQLAIYQDHIELQSLQLYQIEGQILDYQIHQSSKDYLIVLTSTGYYYIFNIQQGDIRAKLKIEDKTTNLSIDPSGLYLLTKSHKNIISLIELATGIKVCDILGTTVMKEIGEFNVSNNCREVIVSDKRDACFIQVYQLDQKISQKVLRVQQQLLMNPNFWTEYPIMLQNTKQFTDNEKQILRQYKQLQDPNFTLTGYHPFLDKSINQAMQLNNQTLKQQQLQLGLVLNQKNVQNQSFNEEPQIMNQRSTVVNSNQRNYDQQQMKQGKRQTSLNRSYGKSPDRSSVYSGTQRQNLNLSANQQNLNLSANQKGKVSQQQQKAKSTTRPSGTAQSRFQRVYQSDYVDGTYRDHLHQSLQNSMIQQPEYQTPFSQQYQQSLPQQYQQYESQNIMNKTPYMQEQNITSKIPFQQQLYHNLAGQSFNNQQQLLNKPQYHVIPQFQEKQQLQGYLTNQGQYPPQTKSLSIQEQLQINNQRFIRPLENQNQNYIEQLKSQVHEQKNLEKNETQLQFQSQIQNMSIEIKKPQEIPLKDQLKTPVKIHNNISPSPEKSILDSLNDSLNLRESTDVKPSKNATITQNNLLQETQQLVSITPEKVKPIQKQQLNSQQKQFVAAPQPNQIQPSKNPQQQIIPAHKKQQTYQGSVEKLIGNTERKMESFIKQDDIDIDRESDYSSLESDVIIETEQREKSVNFQPIQDSQFNSNRIQFTGNMGNQRQPMLYQDFNRTNQTVEIIEDPENIDAEDPYDIDADIS
eukprot:403332785